MAASSSLQVTEDLGKASHTNPNFDTYNDSQEGIIDEDETAPVEYGNAPPLDEDMRYMKYMKDMKNRE